MLRRAGDETAVRAILHGPLYFALGLCLGVCVYFTLDFEPDVLLAGLLAFSAWVVIAAMRRFVLPQGVRLLLVLSVGAASGFALGAAHTRLTSSTPITRSIGPTLVEGWLTSIDPGDNGPRLRIAIHAVAGEAGSGGPQQVRLTHPLSLNVEPGRFVRCWAVLKPPPQPQLPGDYNFARQAYFDGLDAVGYVQGRCRGGTLGARPGLESWIARQVSMARRRLAQHVNRAAGERAGGFAAALASGDRSFMGGDDIEALRRSGLAHLLAISGLHLGIVGTLVYFSVYRGLASWEWAALRVPAQKPAAAMAIIATGAYMVLSGMSISTQRAFIMAAVFFGAILLDRSPLSIRSFSVAMIAVILLQPHAVVTPGFQMSFAATGMLIATFEAWNRRRREAGKVGRRGMIFVLQSLVVTSCVGAAATAPFALYHFDRVAPFGLAANLLAMPIVTFLSAPAAGLALLAAPLGLSDPFLRVFGWSLERVLDIAYLAAGPEERGLSLGHPLPPATLIIVSAALVAVAVARSWSTRLTAIGCAVAGGLILAQLRPEPVVHLAPSGDVFVWERHRVSRFELLDRNGLNPMRYADVQLSGQCMEEPCIVSIPSGRVLIGGAGALAASCESGLILVSAISSPRAQRDCQQTGLFLNMTDPSSGRATTVFQRPGGKLVVRQKPCGQRKWAPCASSVAPMAIDQS